MAEVSAAAVSWKEARLEEEVAAAEAGCGAVADETGVGVGGTTALRKYKKTIKQSKEISHNCTIKLKHKLSEK